MATLTIHRQSEWMNGFRMVKIYVNDELVGSVPNNTSRDFFLNPGKHNVIGKIDWCGCKSVVLNFSAHSHHNIEIKGPKFEKIMLIMSILIGVVLSYFMIVSDVSKAVFFSALIPIVGYRVYFFTLGRNSFIQAKVIVPK